MRQVLLLLLLYAASACLAGEIPPGQTELASLPASDKLANLLRRLEMAYLTADTSHVSDFLLSSPRRYPKEDVLKRLRREFSATKYPTFRLDDDQMTLVEGPTDFAAGGQQFRLLIPCSYTFVSRKAGIGSTAGANDYAYTFDFLFKDGDWWLLGSTLFSTSGMSSSALQVGKFVFFSFLAALVASFWLWMCYHRTKRTKSVLQGFLLFLTTPVGAVVYFFAKYLQETPEEQT